MKIVNQDSRETSIQVSILDNVPGGNFTSPKSRPVLLKNISGEDIDVEIRPAGMSTFITTVLCPGWNPELVTGVKGATEGTLQYGY